MPSILCFWNCHEGWALVPACRPNQLRACQLKACPCRPFPCRPHPCRPCPCRPRACMSCLWRLQKHIWQNLWFRKSNYLHFFNGLNTIKVDLGKHLSFSFYQRCNLEHKTRFFHSLNFLETFCKTSASH